MVLAADDVTDAQVGVIRAGSQVISRHAIAAQQREVLDIRRGFDLLAVDGVAKAHVGGAIARHAEAQHKRLSGRGAPVALGGGKLPHARIEQPRPLAPRPLNSRAPSPRTDSPASAWAGVKSRYARPLWKIACAVSRCTARRSDWRYCSSHPRSSQRSPSKMESSEDRVLRPTSVSSLRRLIAPPSWRAYTP